MTWLLKNWAKIGGVAGVIIFLWIFKEGASMPNLQKLFWVHLAILLLHQFEEYVYPGKFKAFFNTHIYTKTPIIPAALNDYSVFMINVVIAWSAFTYSAMHPQLIWLAMALLFITFINGFLHVLLAIIYRKYNPGVLTGLFLFIPFSLYVGTHISHQMTTQDWKSAIIVGILGHALIPFGVYIGGIIRR